MPRCDTRPCAGEHTELCFGASPCSQPDGAGDRWNTSRPRMAPGPGAVPIAAIAGKSRPEPHRHLARHDREGLLGRQDALRGGRMLDPPTTSCPQARRPMTTPFSPVTGWACPSRPATNSCPRTGSLSIHRTCAGTPSTRGTDATRRSVSVGAAPWPSRTTASPLNWPSPSRPSGEDLQWGTRAVSTSCGTAGRGAGNC